MNYEDKIRLNNLQQRLSVTQTTDNSQYSSLLKSLETREEDIIERLAGAISEMEFNKASDEDIEKALDISRLRRVRQMITRRDGTVYMKTVYKKLEEASAEKTILYNKQTELEEDLDNMVDQEIHFRWKGNVTNTQYETDKAKIVGYDDKTIRVKLTESFDTHNNSNYTYPAGHEFIVPRVETNNWNGDNTVSLLPQQEEIELPLTIQRGQTREVTSVGEVSIGDKIEVETNGGIRRGEVTYIYTPREGVEYRSAAGRTPKLKVKFEDAEKQTYVIPSSSRNTVRVIGSEPETPPLQDMIALLRQRGVSISMPRGSASRVQTGTEEYEVRVRVDRFGRENPRGRSTALRTRTRPTYRDATSAERANGEQLAVNEVAQTYGNFNMVEFRNELKSAINDSNLSYSDRNLSFSFGQNGSLEMRYAGGGIQMTRCFSKAGDNLNVYHAYFTLPRNVQGQNTMKRIFKSLYKQYRNINVKNVSVSANIDIGGYAWAKTGFRTDKNRAQSFVNNMNDLVGRTKTISKTGEQYRVTHEDAQEANRRFQQFYQTHNSTEKFPMRLIASVNQGKAGKALLLGTSWSGVINLHDNQQRADFENYINNV